MRFNAKFLRRVTASTTLEETLAKAVRVLASFHIPHYVCGGFAVQEHGYARFTSDVDLIVPDPEAAIFRLVASGAFRRNPGSNMTVTDKDSRVELDILPGGGSVGRGPLTLPMPTVVSDTPNILSLVDLVSTKLSSYMGSGIKRIQDAADVVELIKANDLPRDFEVKPEVRDTYQKLWDDLYTA